MEKSQSKKIHENPSFEKGSSVEVRSNDPGFDGSWYEATILETPKRLRSSYLVQYKTLLSTPPSSKRSKNERASSLLEEKVCMSLIRPASPCTRDRNAVFEAFQEVEAFHNDGWWPGVILRKMDEIGDDGSYNYSVAFPLSREVFSFRAYDLRKKMVWVADDQGYSWKSNDQPCNYDCDAEEELYKTTFHVGTKVEVSYDKDNYGACWFVATILQIIGRTYCLVKYDTPREDNNDLMDPSLEVVDMQYIRPCPHVSTPEPTMSFKELDKVEAPYKSGWFLGVVSTILPNSMCMIRISEQNKEVLVPFDPTELRIPLVWEDGHWDEISQGKNDRVAHRSKGQKFKRSKLREIDSLTDDQLTQPLKKLKKLKDVNGDKSLHRSSPSHDKDGLSLVYNTVPSSEKHPKSRKVHNDLYRKEYSTSTRKSSPSPDKDGNSVVNNSVRSSERRVKFREDRHDLRQKEYSPNTAKKTIPRKAKNPSPKDKDDVGLKECGSHLSSLASDVCHENAASQIESLTDNAEIFEEIINRDIVEVDHDMENESILDKGNEYALSKDLLANEIVIENESISDEGTGFALSKGLHDENNVIVNGSVSGKGNDFSLNKALSIEENATPFVPCSQMTSHNFESSISKDKWSEMTELVESANEVLRQFPQNPHFQPLLTHAKTLQKGLSCGLMIAFATLVNSIKDLSIDTPDYEFEEKFEVLNYIEDFGFSIGLVRARLEKLKDMHDKRIQLQGKKTSTLSKAEELKKKKELTDLEVLQIDEKVSCLREERTKKVSETNMMESEIEELKSVAMGAEEESLFVESKFGEISKLPW